MNYIWYNPLLSAYQYGNLRDFKVLALSSKCPERFTLLDSFQRSDEKVMTAIADRLNRIHSRYL